MYLVSGISGFSLPGHCSSILGEYLPLLPWILSLTLACLNHPLFLRVCLCIFKYRETYRNTLSFEVLSSPYTLWSGEFRMLIYYLLFLQKECVYCKYTMKRNACKNVHILYKMFRINCHSWKKKRNISE